MSANSELWDYLESLRQSGILCDVRLCLSTADGHDGVALPAHKLVLAASSLYFRNLLATTDSLDDFYSLDGITVDELKLILDFVYRRTSWDELMRNPKAASTACELQILNHEDEINRSALMINIDHGNDGGKLQHKKTHGHTKKPRIYLSGTDTQCGVDKILKGFKQNVSKCNAAFVADSCDKTDNSIVYTIAKTGTRAGVGELCYRPTENMTTAQQPSSVENQQPPRDVSPGLVQSCGTVSLIDNQNCTEVTGLCNEQSGSFKSYADDSTQILSHSKTDNFVLYINDMNQIKSECNSGETPDACGDSGPFICMLCTPNKHFKNSTGLRNHNAWKHNAVPARRTDAESHKCTMCLTEVRSYAALAVHMRRCHNMLQEHQCEHCDASFSKLRVLHSHLSTAHSIDSFLCDVCQARFKSREGWRIHIQKQHSTNDPAEMCTTCGKVFMLPVELRNHMRITHALERNYVCDLCRRAFKNRQALRRHLLTFHSKERHFECDICGSRFKTRCDLTNHRRLHERDMNPLPATGRLQAQECEQRRHICQFCAAVFLKRSRLTRHELHCSESSTFVKYFCPECRHVFTTAFSLRCHVMSRHQHLHGTSLIGILQNETSEHVVE